MHVMASARLATENPAERIKKSLCCFKVSLPKRQCAASRGRLELGSRLLSGVYSGFGRGYGFFRCSPVTSAGAGRRMRKGNAKHGSLRRSPLHHDFASVILNDL